MSHAAAEPSLPAARGLEAPAEPTRPGALRQTVEVLRKDLLIEWRGRSRAVALGGYALVLLLLFSFAVGPSSRTLQAHAAGYLWLVLLSISTLTLGSSFRVETEAGALEGLLLTPVDPRALFYGKALANTALLVGMGVLALPASVVLFDLHLAEGPLWLLAGLVLGAGGLAAPGTLYAALTARLGAQQLVLPLLLFPLVVPSLVAATKVTGLALQGDPMGQAGSWVALLACFNAIFWSLCGVLFGKVVEE